jgi:hypothetical protein
MVAPVHELYGLTEAEIKVVEGAADWSGQTNLWSGAPAAPQVFPKDFALTARTASGAYAWYQRTRTWAARV